MKKNKILTALIATSLLSSVATYTPISNHSHVAEAAGTSITATKKLIEKYGTDGFNTSTTVTRSELNRLANQGSSEKEYSGHLRGIVTALILYPVAPEAGFGLGVASDLMSGLIPHYSDQLNSTLKKSTAKKFKLTMHWRYIRHGAGKYYVVDSFSAKPL